MAWVDKASVETSEAQYKAFVKDIFYHLYTVIGATRLTKAGFNLDNTLLDEQTIVSFPPLDKDNPASVQRSNDLSILHRGFMGAVKKLIKVYGAVRVVADSTDHTKQRLTL